MASHQTTNFQLCQWEADDEVLRADFNSDNLKIENALSAIKTVADVAYTPENSPIVTGTYTGDGATTRVISLGFTPKAVLVMPRDSELVRDSSSHTYYYGGLAVTGSNAASSAAGATSWVCTSTIVAIAESGFQVGYDDGPYSSYLTNESGTVYHYVAFR